MRNSRVRYYSIIRCRLDECVPLGVCRQFAKLWFDASSHEKDFYFGQLIDDFDSVLDAETTSQVARSQTCKRCKIVRVSSFRYIFGVRWR